MSEHTAVVAWERGQSRFSDGRYSRAHRWRFDGGAEVLASSAPEVVPAPLSDPAGVDPEEALVASLSSCHMLWFLAIAAKRGFVVDRYEDRAGGVVGRNAQGRTAVLSVTLRPRAEFSGGKVPTPEELTAMHDKAHHECFIANSVTAEVRVEAA